MVDGIEDSLVRAIIVEYRDRVFVAAIFNLLFNKEEFGPKVIDCFLGLLSYLHEIAYIWVDGWI